ncbi:MAG: Clp protease N-terminal domain-containing protein [Pirellulaceae bacterium]
MVFRFEKLTVKAQEAVAAAQGRAASLGNPDLDTLHVLQALLAEADGIVVPLLKKMGVSVDQLQYDRQRTRASSESQRWPRASTEPHLADRFGCGFQSG